MPSLASAPELQKKTLSANVCSTRRAARRSACGTRYRLLVCMTRPACSAIAWTRCGWPWPSEEVAMPAPKSRNRRPSAVIQPGAFAPLESEVGAVVGRHQGGNHLRVPRTSPLQLPATSPARTDLRRTALGKRITMASRFWREVNARLRGRAIQRSGPASRQYWKLGIEFNVSAVDAAAASAGRPRCLSLARTGTRPACCRGRGSRRRDHGDASHGRRRS